MTIMQKAKKELRNNGLLWCMVLPGLLVLIFFKIAPLFGLIIAFENYSSFQGVFKSDWVWFENFQEILTDPYTWTVAKNTVLLAFWTLVFSFPIPIMFSVLLEEVRFNKLKGIVQSVSFFPYFISVAVAVSILSSFVSPSDGIINMILQKVGLHPVNFMAEAGWFRPLYVIVHVWQNFGYAAIVYIAAIRGIDPGYYEAAKIDGVNRWQKIKFITLPCLIPMMVTMFIVNLGSILSVDINKILLMQNPSTYATSDVLQTYVYRMAFGTSGFPQYSLGTALSMVQSVIAFILVMATNKISEKISDSSAF